MKKISAGVFIESGYAGVTLAALVLPKGIVQIDAPISPDDGRAWQQTIRDLGGGPGRLLINLDAHPDRTLGVFTMDNSVLAHEATAESFVQRPTIFKAQMADSGAEWENLKGLSGIRWKPPNLVFTEQTRIHWNEAAEVLVEHHPGPEKGACWVVLPDKKVVFIGDAVVAKQPPFLAEAHLGSWLETLNLLLSKEYKGFKVISSRSGQVGEKDIRNILRFITSVDKQLDRISKRKASPQATEKLVEKLLPTLETQAKYRNFYTQRLQYGLYHCYARNYYSGSSK
jgi:glyoxylase-like metal-dependent hydrolase (beta-lactamase superfamily II)